MKYANNPNNPSSPISPNDMLYIYIYELGPWARSRVRGLFSRLSSCCFEEFSLHFSRQVIELVVSIASTIVLGHQRGRDTGSGRYHHGGYIYIYIYIYILMMMMMMMMMMITLITNTSSKNKNRRACMSMLV